MTVGVVPQDSVLPFAAPGRLLSEQPPRLGQSDVCFGEWECLAGTSEAQSLICGPARAAVEKKAPADSMSNTKCSMQAMSKRAQYKLKALQ